MGMVINGTTITCRTLHVLSLDRSTPRVQVRTRLTGRRSWTTPRDGTGRPPCVPIGARLSWAGRTDGRVGHGWERRYAAGRWSAMGGSNSACGHAVRVDMGGSSVKTWVARVDTQCVDNSVTQLVARKASTRDNTSSASTWVGETAGASHPPRHGWVVAAASTCVGRRL